MRILGYEDLFPDGIEVDELTEDGWRFASMTGFWAAHLLAQGFGEEAELVLSAFGVSESEVRRLLRELRAPDVWPLFDVRLKGGQQLLVVYRNLEGDSGVDYLLDPGGGRPSIRLAALEGAFSGPGISWLELVRVAQSGASADGGESARRMAILLPMLGDASVTDDVVGDVSAALTLLGAGADDAAQLAGVLLRAHPMWEPPTWSRGPTGSLVCDGIHSVRNPRGPVTLGPAGWALISAAFE